MPEPISFDIETYRPNWRAKRTRRDSFDPARNSIITTGLFDGKLEKEAQLNVSYVDTVIIVSVNRKYRSMSLEREARLPLILERNCSRIGSFRGNSPMRNLSTAPLSRFVKM